MSLLMVDVIKKLGYAVKGLVGERLAPARSRQNHSLGYVHCLGS